MFETQRVALGDVFQHHRYEVRYPFTVVGEGAVRIQEMLPNHGLTEAHLDPPMALGDWLPVGTQAAVVVTFDAGRYRDNMGTNLILVGDFQSAREELFCSAFIIPVFELEPPIIQFGSIHEKELGEESLGQIIQVAALEDFEILSWTRRPPGVLLEALEGKEVTDDGRIARSLRITPGPAMKEGRMSSSFIGETSLGIQLEIMVNAEVIGLVKYGPSSRVAFGIFDAGNERRRVVRVEAMESDLVLPLPTVTVSGEAVKVMTAEVRTVIGDRQYNILLNIGKHAPPGSYNGVLRITYPEASGLAPKEMFLNARIRSSR